MAWFQNKQTGLNWEIIDKEVIQRLQKDDNYQIIDTLKEEDITKNKNTKTTKSK